MSCPNPRENPVDVIVPVYRGLAETRRCLESVLACPRSMRFEVVVVDDFSPEPALSAWLDELAGQDRITLLRNPENLGFVRSVNRGMALHPDRDVILLNSDTEVANDWLDRLRAAAWREPDIGTATPFSNNATICSYPYEGWAGGVPGSLGLATLDRLFAATNAGLSVDLPTAVGFCMYIRRACLDAVGLFDADRFGRGYGEENDFCLRAERAGWRNVLAADVFVFHEGAVSFSEERHALQQTAMAALLEAHPDYLDRVGDFIRRDPAAPLRAAVDRARGWHGPVESRHLREEWQARNGPASSDRPVLLHLGHAWGGGTERWMADFRHADGEHRHLVLRSRSERNVAGWRLELLEPESTDIPILAWNLERPIATTAIAHPEYRAILNGIIETFQVCGLLVSSLIGHALDALETGLPTVLVLHDLYPFCPALFGYFDSPCTACPDERLAACLRHNPYNAFWHNSEVEDWRRLRDRLAELLQRQEGIRIAAPSASVRERWTVLLPALAGRPWQLIPHGLDTALLQGPIPAPREGERLRLVVPGRLLPHKGLALLRAALPELTRFADLLLLGSGEFGRAFAGAPGVKVVENYTTTELAGHLADFRPDCALLLSLLPESFSYTLSEMHALGVPVAATRLGAFAERIEHGVTGLLFGPTPAELLDLMRPLAADRSMLMHIRKELSARPVADPAGMVRAYHALLALPARPFAATVADRGLLAAVLRQGELEREVAWFRDEYRRRGDLTGRMTMEAEHGVDRIRRLDDRVALLEAERAALLTSTSWRLTTPLRTLVDWLRGRGGQTAAAPVLSAQPARPIPSASPPRAPSPACPPTGLGRAMPAAEMAGLRSPLRHDLGVADRTRLLLVLGRPATPSLAARLAGLASAAVAARNDVCLILVDDDDDDDNDDAGAAVWNGVREELRLLEVTRRLFRLPYSPACLAAVDGLLCLADDAAARDCLCLAEGWCLPALTAEAVAGLTPEDMAGTLDAWLGGPAGGEA